MVSMLTSWDISATQYIDDTMSKLQSLHIAPLNTV